MKFLVLPHIEIQNANALSSPFTIGFPAMTAWLGATHKIEREMNQRQEIFGSVKIGGVGVISHDFHLHTYKGFGDFNHSIVGTGNPLDKKGERPSFIEEARCQLEVSLILKFDKFEKFNPFDGDEEKFSRNIKKILLMMKMASGDVLKFDDPVFENADEIKQQCRLLRSLMPGYALIERRDLMIQSMKEGKDALDALLSAVWVESESEKDKKDQVSWKSKKKYNGWIVPIATGFHGVTDLTPSGKTLNQRDPSYPHRFAESVVTLGEFRMIYKFKNIEELLWYYDYKREENLYLCKNRNTNNNFSSNTKGV